MSDIKLPNPQTWRPEIGPDYVTALILICEKRNADALKPIGILDWLRKMIRHWWKSTFPTTAFPGDSVEPDYHIGPDCSVHSI